MDYSLIIRPLIGAGIGYVTNWIAVKMLFRPLKPIKIGNFTLPFTPGIIPKNKKRIAESIGKSISENLLTEESITNVLLSDKKIQELKSYLCLYLFGIFLKALLLHHLLCNIQCVFYKYLYYLNVNY